MKNEVNIKRRQYIILALDIALIVLFISILAFLIIHINEVKVANSNVCQMCINDGFSCFKFTTEGIATIAP